MLSRYVYYPYSSYYEAFDNNSEKEDTPPKVDDTPPKVVEDTQSKEDTPDVSNPDVIQSQSSSNGGGVVYIRTIAILVIVIASIVFLTKYLQLQSATAYWLPLLFGIIAISYFTFKDYQSTSDTTDTEELPTTTTTTNESAKESDKELTSKDSVNEKVNNDDNKIKGTANIQITESSALVPGNVIKPIPDKPEEDKSISNTTIIQTQSTKTEILPKPQKTSSSDIKNIDNEDPTRVPFYDPEDKPTQLSHLSQSTTTKTSNLEASKDTKDTKDAKDVSEEDKIQTKSYMTEFVSNIFSTLNFTTIIIMGLICISLFGAFFMYPYLTKASPRVMALEATSNGLNGKFIIYLLILSAFTGLIVYVNNLVNKKTEPETDPKPAAVEKVEKSSSESDTTTTKSLLDLGTWLQKSIYYIMCGLVIIFVVRWISRQPDTPNGQMTYSNNGNVSRSSSGKISSLLSFLTPKNVWYGIILLCGISCMTLLIKSNPGCKLVNAMDYIGIGGIFSSSMRSWLCKSIASEGGATDYTPDVNIAREVPKKVLPYTLHDKLINHCELRGGHKNSNVCREMANKSCTKYITRGPQQPCVNALSKYCNIPNPLQLNKGDDCLSTASVRCTEAYAKCEKDREKCLENDPDSDKCVRCGDTNRCIAVLNEQCKKQSNCFDSFLEFLKEVAGSDYIKIWHILKYNGITTREKLQNTSDPMVLLPWFVESEYTEDYRELKNTIMRIKKLA
jgi:hypothetical protein